MAQKQTRFNSSESKSDALWKADKILTISKNLGSKCVFSHTVAFSESSFPRERDHAIFDVLAF